MTGGHPLRIGTQRKAPTTPTLTRGLTRADGPAKLTGGARYAADHAAAETGERQRNPLVAVLVTATVPNGRLAELDTAGAAGAPGVHQVITHGELPKLAELPSPPLGHPALPMRDDTVHYEGEPIAVVLADTLQNAQYAAGLVTARYADVTPAVVFGAGEDVVPTGGHVLGETDEVTGDVAAGLAAAEVTVRETYTTADRHHSPIEPAVTLAEWEGDQLTVHSSVQSAVVAQQTLAALFGIAAEQVRVVCPFVGGGFGCKGYVWPPQVLAASAARVVDRPVKLVLSRAQMFTLCGHQPATRQSVELGATRDGRLTALRHLSSSASSRAGDYVETTTHSSTWLYDSPAIEARLRIQRLDRAAPTPMRAPHEGPGMFALESAMDELAHRLGMDPVELRIRNEPAVDPLTGKPFSSRPLVACLREGAARFGWADRGPVGSMRDGHDLVGWGMAVATMDTFRAPSSAKLRVDADGHVTVTTGMQEIGTGLPSMVRTVAAETLGCDPEDVAVRHGDTEFPPHTGTMGSMSTMNLGSAVRAAAEEILAKLGAETDHDGRATANGRDAAAGRGRARRGPALADLMAEAGLTELEAEGRWAPDEDSTTNYSIHTYGAIFVEVRVDADLGLVRMPRAVGVYAAGRIINPLAAHSQMTGGVIWGYGQAVLERSVFEPRLGRFLAKNLAGYIVPVNADIGSIDVSFVEDDDRHASAIGAKGIGELAAVGVAPAIANAVFHATGKRVRDVPIRLHDLLDLPVR
jgi:xanthine dehydrogenase YagR molybdenum-binding subunit